MSSTTDEKKPISRSKFVFVLFILLFFGVFCLISQLQFLRTCYDPDMDSYIHFVNGIRLIQHPTFLGIHWVWLPFYHYLLSGLILLGATFDFVRLLNVCLFFITLIIFTKYIYRSTKDLYAFLLAPVIFLIFPIQFYIANSSEPEVLFSLSLLIFAISMQKKKYVPAVISISIASITRYESWAVLGLLAIYFAYHYIKFRTFRIDGRILPLFTLITPILLLALWFSFRWFQQLPLFGFIQSTMEFGRTNESVKKFVIANPILDHLFDITYFPLIVPFIYTGPLLFLAIAGIKKTCKDHFWLSLTAFGVLSFITLSWLMKSNLGLPRHYVSLLPFFAISTALGLERFHEWMIRFIRQTYPHTNFWAVKNVLAFFTIVILIDFSIHWYKIWVQDGMSRYCERRAAALVIQHLPAKQKIFMWDSVVEVFADIDTSRVRRLWVKTKTTPIENIRAAVQQEGEAYIVIPDSELKTYGGLGKVIYRSLPNKMTQKVFAIVEVKNQL